MQLLPEGKAPLVMAFCPVYLEILVDTCPNTRGTVLCEQQQFIHFLYLSGPLLIEEIF